MSDYPWFRATFNAAKLSRSQVEEALALSIDVIVQDMVSDDVLQHATRADLNFEINPLRKARRVLRPYPARARLLGCSATTLSDSAPIQTPMTVSVRLTIRKDRPYTKTPHFKTAAHATNAVEEYYTTTGVDPDMREATRAAVRNMIEFLGTARGLSRMDAYMLCSVAGDLRLHEVVDMPNYVVGMMMPKSVLGTVENAHI